MRKSKKYPGGIHTDLNADTVSLMQIVVDAIPNFTALQPLDAASKATAISAAVNQATITLGTLKVGLVDVRCLDIDPSYQTVELRRIWRLTNVYDIEKTKIIELSYRDGKLYDIDGVHRVIGAIVNGNVYLLAMIHMNWTREQEANQFRYQNQDVTTIKPLESFIAGVAACDPTDVSIKTVCEKYNLTVTKPNDKSVANPMAAVSAARRVVDDHGGDPTVLDWTFDLMTAANWIGRPKCVTSKTIFAFAKAYDAAVDAGTLPEATDNLLSVMKPIDPVGYETLTTIVYNGKERRSAMNALTVDVAMGRLIASDLLPRLVPAIALTRDD